MKNWREFLPDLRSRKRGKRGVVVLGCKMFLGQGRPAPKWERETDPERVQLGIRLRTTTTRTVIVSAKELLDAIYILDGFEELLDAYLAWTHKPIRDVVYALVEWMEEYFGEEEVKRIFQNYLEREKAKKPKKSRPPLNAVLILNVISRALGKELFDAYVEDYLETGLID